MSAVDSETQERSDNEPDWKKEASKIQQELYEKLGDRRWDYIRWDQRWALESKVGFAIFGTPTEESEDIKSGYSKGNAEEIKRICDIIYDIRKCLCVYIAFLFVIGKGSDGLFVVPVFRVLTPDETVIFLDHFGRSYKSWKHFEDTNSLQKCELCYPEDGIYQADNKGRVLVTFGKSPACSVTSKVLDCVDKASTVGTVALIGAGLISFIVPLTAPVAIAATVGSTVFGVYGTARGSHQLHDRRIHKQSISPVNRDARNCWISVVGSAVGVGSGLITRGMISMVGTGQVIGKAGTIAADVLKYGALSINGIGVVNGLANIIVKKIKDKLTSLDILQFTSTVLFFTNVAFNAKTVKSIIEQVETESCCNVTAELSKERDKALKKLLKNTGEGETMGDTYRVVKVISIIRSKDEFFRMMIRAQKQSGSKVLNNEEKLVDDGNSYVDTEIERD